jgi:hypothetical protein
MRYLALFAQAPLMLNPLIIGLIVFLIVLAAAFAGWAVKQR